jgi:EAL domain-containing protein (putative c-di-GMP-specific phosphodiesterase class I)
MLHSPSSETVSPERIMPIMEQGRLFKMELQSSTQHCKQFWCWKPSFEVTSKTENKECEVSGEQIMEQQNKSF